MTELNNRNFKVDVATGSNFELKTMDDVHLDASGFGTYTSGGMAYRVYEIETPYAAADLADIKFVQSADVITITHKNYAPREVSRTGHISWSISKVAFAPEQATPGTIAFADPGGTGKDYTYHVTAINSVTFEESLVSCLR